MKRLAIFVAVVVYLCTPFAQAQTQQISGRVTSAEDGSGIPGASIVVKGTTFGTITDFEGNYTLDAPADAVALIFSFVGMKTQDIRIDGRSTIDVVLESDVFGLDEVIVTGVSSGTATKKLGFDIGKVDEEQLAQVPAIDAANAIRGKVAGVRIVQPSGNPSDAPQIRLRGSTSIVGGQSPLIIVDGVITSGSLNDINMEDVKSIEIIKGSAGSSLYGSLAGNGVIQIITKRGGTAAGRGRTDITLKNEYGQSFLNSDYPLTNHHYWQMDPATGRRDKDMLDVEYINNPQNAADSADYRFQRLLADNDYSVLYDHVKEIYVPQPYYTNYISLSHNTEMFQLHTSFENKYVTGIVEGEDPWVRRNFRLNVDFNPTDQWRLSISSSYNTIDGYAAIERGQGSNIFYSALMAEPNIDFTAKDPETGEYVNQFEDYDNNWHNPLYVAANRRLERNRDRFLGGLDLRYKPVDWISLTAQYSLDRTDYDNQTFYPIGYVTPGQSTLNFGSFSVSRNVNWKQVGALQGQAEKTFGDLRAQLTLKYLYESQHQEGLSGSGSHFTSRGVRTLDAVDPDSRDVGSYIRDTKAENVFANLVMDFRDKLIFDGLVRRDGSSRFGEDSRYAVYYRTALSYILTEDITIPGIDFTKIRLSYGTSGQRPGFSAQYETYSVGASGISPGVLGNKDLKPSTVEALEGGIEINFLRNYIFRATYENTNAKDQFLQVPLSGVAGYSSQWQNAGTMHTTALEFSVEGSPLHSANFSWDFGITWDRITQEITELNRPAWTFGTGATAIFRVEEDKPYGTMYGNQLVTSISQLTLDADGYVMNDYNYDPSNPDNNLRPSDFVVNSDGYIIVAGTENTRAEQVHYIVDEEGTPVVGEIGNSNPDFNFGFFNTLNYKGIQLYLLFEGQVGGDIYNYTRQLMNFNDRHGDFEDYAAQGKSVDYHSGSSRMYNRADPNDYYVEDGTYVKLREVALSYSIPVSNWGIDFIKDIIIGVTARNILTFTDYTGFDPEVSYGSNATNFRVDEYTYPHFATWTGSLTLKF
ncbi:MAG: SusC/RagA family TonB-linked outer membrane protein [Bacteroidales bacterium]|nr:MAG: SusC/RagA family TonB-linked outer membrane protein [Bacteroidales bacterium]